MNIISKEIIEETFMLPLYITGAVGMLIVLISGIMWITHINKTHNYTDRYSKNIVIIWFSTLILYMFLMISFSVFWKVPSDRYRYEMTFDTIESSKEAFDTYNFIEYKDGVYVFEDKQK